MAELEAATSKVIRSGCYLHGPETKAFEEELAAMCGADYAIGVSNGLDALRLILRGYMELGKLHKGDAVMVAANTFIATVIPITEFGLIPVFVEPDPLTMNFNWEEALGILKDNDSSQSPLNIRCAMITHLYGTPCWNRKAADEMHGRGMMIVEDNAQALGAEAAEEGFNGVRFTGNLADAAAVSFYPTKNVGALGDAGAVITNEADLAAVVKALANYGTDKRYHNLYVGYNCRIDEIQAAMLRVKLRYIKNENIHRQKIAELYASKITNPLVEVPAIFPDMVQVWHQYVVRVPENLRDDIRDFLADGDIPTDIHYPTPPYCQPCYASIYHPEEDTVAIKLANSCISLPIANMTAEKVSEVSNIINRFRS